MIFQAANKANDSMCSLNVDDAMKKVDEMKADELKMEVMEEVETNATTDENECFINQEQCSNESSALRHKFTQISLTTLNKFTQTSLTINEIDELKSALKKKNVAIEKLNIKIQFMEFWEDLFRGNDQRTLYYTGLPNSETLFIVCDTVKGFLLAKRSVCALSPFQQLIMTLTKLRLNLPFHDLSYRYLSIYLLFKLILTGK